MTGFQRLCLATTAVVFVLIVIGGTVRATDSGLGCPDWPRCQGSFIPKWETHTLIEYSHRLTASVVGLLIFAVAAWAWRVYRHSRSIFYPAAAAFALVLVQGALGGLTVVHELPPEIVTVHLGTALALFALMILITMTAFAHTSDPAREPAAANLGGIAAAAAALALGAMLLGAYVAGAGYSLACSGWPLCNGDVVPTASAESVQLVFMHRLLALILGIALLALMIRARAGAWRQGETLARVAFAVYLVQALIGAANIWTEVADLAQIAHLAVGAALWAILAYMNIRLFAVQQLLDSGANRVQDAPRLVRVVR